jgi:hypothetical protein
MSVKNSRTQRTIGEMVAALDGARLKVVRAQKHLDSLKDEIRRYEQSKPYRLTVENDIHVPGFVVPTWSITAGPDPYLSTIIGDVLCNLRSALDYVAWELAAKYVGRPLDGPPAGKDWISFPIVSSQKYFRRDALEEYQIPASVIDEIESVQPYGGGYHPLWLLKLLVDSDKHRLPVLIRGRLRGVTVVIQHVGPVALPADSNPAISGKKQPVGMRAQLAVFVALQDPSMPWEPVELTLENIVKSVADVIRRFERFLS